MNRTPARTTCAWLVHIVGLPALLFAASTSSAQDVAGREGSGTPLDGLREATPIPGIYETSIGAEVFYTTEDGSYVLFGELFDLRNRRNLTDIRRGELNVSLLQAIPEEDLVVFTPRAGSVEHTLHVFVSLNCPYCSRFHQEIDELLARQYEIRYLLYAPEEDQELVEKSVSIMCAADRTSAFTMIINGNDTTPIQGTESGAESCDGRVLNALANHRELVRVLNIDLTPTAITESGRFIIGHTGFDYIIEKIAEPIPYQWDTIDTLLQRIE